MLAKARLSARVPTLFVNQWMHIGLSKNIARLNPLVNPDYHHWNCKFGFISFSDTPIQSFYEYRQLKLSTWLQKDYPTTSSPSCQAATRVCCGHTAVVLFKKRNGVVDNSWFTWETSAKTLLLEDYIVRGLNHETYGSSSKMTMSWCRQWGWLLDDYNHPTTGGKFWWI